MLLLYVATALAESGRGALYFLLPLNALELGGLFSGFAIPGMLALGVSIVSVPAASAVARFGAKAVMVFGLSLAALGALATVGTESLVLMGAAALANGLGMGVWALARLIYVSQTVPLGQRGRAIAPLGGVQRIGMFVGPGLAGLGVHAIGFSATLLLATLLVTAAVLLVALRAPSTEPTPVQSDRAVLARIFLLMNEHQRTLLTAGVAMGILALLRMGRVVLLPICGALLGLSEPEIGLVGSISSGADMVLFYPAGQVMDRLGRKWTALPCLALLSLGVVLVVHAEGYAGFLVGGLVAGVGNGLGSGINMTLAADYAPERGRAEFIAVWRLLSDSGGALSPFLIGAVASLASLGATALVCGGAGALGMILMGWLAREPRVHAGEG